MQRPSHAYQQVIDGVAGDDEAHKAEQTDGPQAFFVPDILNPVAVTGAADNVHRACAKAANEQKQKILRAVLCQVADVFKGGKTGPRHHGGNLKLLVVRLEYRKIKQQRRGHAHKNVFNVSHWVTAF